MSIFDEVTQRISSQVDSRVTGAIKGFNVAGAGTALARAAVGKYAPKANNALSAALRGDYAGAALDAFRQTELGAKIQGALTGSFASDVLFNSMANPLLGGITPLEASQIYADVMATKYAKKNLFFLEILDYFPQQGGTQQKASGLFNLFATGLSFSAQTVTGEAVNLGAAQMDQIHGSERTEMRITTYDDAYGSMKRWFEYRAGLVAHQDGTFGVPADYIVCVRVLHAAINDEVMQKFGGFEQKFIMRPGQIETELSRTEDGLQEVQMTFTQFDTFMFEQQ
jgi:hypothetical protein